MPRATSTSLWRIDPCLRLQPARALPRDAQPLRMPEEAIDTVLGRNVDRVCTALFGAPGTFLFNSSQYIGAFDVGAMLPDGQVLCFENKRGRPSTQDLDKFARDARQVRDEGIIYLMHRHQHHIRYWDEYVDTTRGMFAAFFLKVSSAFVPASRNLVGEAAKLLGISCGELQRRHEAGNGWLHALRGKMPRSTDPYLSLYDYLNAKKLWPSPEAILPVLLVTTTELADLAPWQRQHRPTAGISAFLANYRFYTSDQPYPTWLTLEAKGHFRV